jgi:ketosteroid isomerase-like protein
VSEENVEVVRRIHKGWSRGDFSSVDWADPEIEFRTPEFMAGKTHHGIEALAREWASWLHAFDDFRSEAFEYFDGGDQVVTFNRFSGSGKASGLPMSEIPGCARFVLRDGKVVELEIYTDRKRALQDAGIDPEGGVS